MTTEPAPALDQPEPLDSPSLKDVLEYLVKLADWCAGMGFCQIDGIDDPDRWLPRLWERLSPGDPAYTPEKLSAALARSISL